MTSVKLVFDLKLNENCYFNAFEVSYYKFSQNNPFSPEMQIFVENCMIFKKYEQKFGTLHK